MYLIFSLFPFPFLLFVFFFFMCVHVYMCVFLLSLSPPRAPVPVEHHVGDEEVVCGVSGVNKRRIKGVERSGRAVYTSVECGVCVAE